MFTFVTLNDQTKIPIVNNDKDDLKFSPIIIGAYGMRIDITKRVKEYKSDFQNEMKLLLPLPAKPRIRLTTGYRAMKQWFPWPFVPTDEQLNPLLKFLSENKQTCPKVD